MKKSILSIIACLCILVPVQGQGQRAQVPDKLPPELFPEYNCKTIQFGDTSGEQIPILGWHGLPGLSKYSTAAHYREMADAGFTINMPHELCHVDSAILSTPPEKYFALLDLAQATGMKIFVGGGVMDFFSPDEIKRLVAHPALAGYSLRDEPALNDFAALGATVRKIQAIDNTHPCYINMFPANAKDRQLGTNGYQEYVLNYIREIPVPFLSFDHYPIIFDKATGQRRILPKFYENLEIISGESKKIGKPFWAFALSTAHGDYPVPALADLRLQVYSDLAYGAQCIQYFTWFDPWGETPDDDAPIRIDGTKSNSYYTVQAMNREIIALSKVFLNSRTVWTAHTGTIPRGCTELDKSKLPPVIQSLEISEPGALVSLLEKGSDRFLVIVNHDINQEITVNVTGRSGLRMVNKDGDIVPVVAKQTLTPGDAMILFWKK
ncbi:MAG: hypothetical protein LBT46_00830 [Planctomycetaceae bacterium]|jgi:hypothetical protein|nr:hypothetical protein [Planctomycetaceae bacterium]